jgi:hypothetical protein
VFFIFNFFSKVSFYARGGQAVDMHRVFQRDLCKLRLATARSYVKIITDVHGPIANNGMESRCSVSELVCVGV